MHGLPPLRYHEYFYKCSHRLHGSYPLFIPSISLSWAIDHFYAPCAPLELRIIRFRDQVPGCPEVCYKPAALPYSRGYTTDLQQRGLSHILYANDKSSVNTECPLINKVSCLFLLLLLHQVPYLPITPPSGTHHSLLSLPHSAFLDRN